MERMNGLEWDCGNQGGMALWNQVIFSSLLDVKNYLG
jgi:hypothetical protein